MSTQPAQTLGDGAAAPAPRFSFGPRPSIGVGAAGKAVAEDVSALVNAHVELAKAELAQSAKGRAKQAGAFGAAGVLGWLGLQGLLVTAGFALALVVPGWAAAGIVTLVLLLGAGVAALVGKRQQTALTLDATKSTVRDDVSVIRSHLGKQP